MYTNTFNNNTMLNLYNILYSKHYVLSTNKVIEILILSLIWRKNYINQCQTKFTLKKTQRRGSDRF